MSTANYTAEGLLILTVEQETQILNQMETAIKLMQGKITLKQAQPSLGKIVYQSTDIVSFQPLFPTPNQKVYSHL